LIRISAFGMITHSILLKIARFGAHAGALKYNFAQVR
jgi:hypothetical protein